MGKNMVITKVVFSSKKDTNTIYIGNACRKHTKSALAATEATGLPYTITSKNMGW